MRYITVLLCLLISHVNCLGQIDPYNWGVYYSVEDFMNGNVSRLGKFVKADPTGYWIEFFQNNSKVRMKANEAKVWGYKDVYGFNYRIIDGKFCPIVDEGPIILYSNRTIPRRSPAGVWEMRVKAQWTMAARSHSELPIRLFEIMNKDKLADWLRELDDLKDAEKLKRDIYLTQEIAAESMYKMIRNFNRSKRNPQ